MDAELRLLLDTGNAVQGLMRAIAQFEHARTEENRRLLRDSAEKVVPLVERCEEAAAGARDEARRADWRKTLQWARQLRDTIRADERMSVLGNAYEQ